VGHVSDEERIAAAEAYVDALVSHDADNVPFSADCIRIENGIKTGFSGKHLRRSLTRGPQYRIIEAATDRTFSSAQPPGPGTVSVVTTSLIAGWLLRRWTALPR